MGPAGGESDQSGQWHDCDDGNIHDRLRERRGLHCGVRGRQFQGVLGALGGWRLVVDGPARQGDPDGEKGHRRYDEGRHAATSAQ
eukprot:305220-Prymnesium_polylepis.1